jgi:preprotein translocase subunit SecE
MARTRKNAISRELDPSRWAHAVFAVLGFIAAWVLTNLVEDGWATAWSYWPQLARPDRVIANGVGVGVALVATIVAWRRPTWFHFITEVVVEVSQVTWPSRAETRAATLVVIVMTVVCSAILFGMDSTWSTFTDLLYDT